MTYSQIPAYCTMQAKDDDYERKQVKLHEEANQVASEKRRIWLNFQA